MSTSRSSAASLARRAGYTLIEMMMVVTIIGLSTLAFAPGIGRANTDRRVSTVARELIRVGRRARSDTFGYLRAHLIWINPATGVVQLLRGSTNSCTLSIAGWSAMQADCTASPVGQRCLENLSVPTLANDSTIYMYEELLASAGTTTYQQNGRALCYSPDGLVYWGTGDDLATATAALSPQNSATIRGGFVYTIHKGTTATASAPISTSRTHRVLFPLGGTARSLR